MTGQTTIDEIRSGRPGIGIVFNAFSGNNRKHAEELRARLSAMPDARFREVTELHQATAVLDELTGDDTGLLVIAGGDGMVQEVIGFLMEHRPRETWPVLSIIPGGTTNMTAADMGYRGGPVPALTRLENLLRNRGRVRLVERPSLRIEERGKPANYGMFFGAGLIARGVKYSRSRIKQIGVTGPIFSAIIALRCLAGFVFGGGKGDWQPARMTLTSSNAETIDGTFMFAFASTLNTLIFDSCPYWGDEQAPIHVTMVRQHHGFSWLDFLRILKGKGREINRREIYSSHNYKAIDLALHDEYIIDGELYRTDEETSELRISVTENLTFLVP